MLGVINENIEVSNDGDNVFEKLTALSKLSVTRWTVRANFFNKVKSLNILVFKDFIFSVIYFSIILTFHFGFGNNSFLCLASISNMYRYLRVKLYVTEIQRIDFSVLYNTVYLQTTDGSSLRWVSRREFENRSTMKNYLFQMMSFKFFYGINVSFTIYSITDSLSKTLQAQAILAVEAQETTKLFL